MRGIIRKELTFKGNNAKEITIKMKEYLNRIENTKDIEKVQRRNEEIAEFMGVIKSTIEYINNFESISVLRVIQVTISNFYDGKVILKGKKEYVYNIEELWFGMCNKIVDGIKNILTENKTLKFGYFYKDKYYFYDIKNKVIVVIDKKHILERGRYL